MKIDVRHNFPEVMAKLQRLPGELRDKAMASALNKTSEKARTESVRAVTDEYNVKASDIRPRFHLRRATSRGLQLVATLEAFGRRRGGRAMNVIHFLERKVTLAEARRRRKAGTLNDLRFKFKRGGGMKTIPGAFLGNQGRTVFRRIPGTTMGTRSKFGGTKHAEQIEPVTVIDLPQMFTSRKINERVVARIQREFPVEFDRAARLVLSRFK
ncbi:MAG TPA: phage tail protein [Burkholderiales bacterium]|nr:phage tail protein [Burkholderiales bacterium]